MVRTLGGTLVDADVNGTISRLNFLTAGSVLNVAYTVVLPVGYWFGKIKGWW